MAQHRHQPDCYITILIAHAIPLKRLHQLLLDLISGQIYIAVNVCDQGDIIVFTVITFTLSRISITIILIYLTV